MKQPTTVRDWWNCGVELRALETAINTSSLTAAITAAQQLLSRIAGPLPPRPRPPRDAGVSAQTKYTAELEAYTRALEARLGVQK